MPLNNIYPPVLNSTQPAFSVNSSPYYIFFSLPSVMSYDNIGHIQIRIVKQTNNRTIVDTSKYPDGIIYKSKTSIQNATTIREGETQYDESRKSQYYVAISQSELAENWKEGYQYKVQLRFGTTGIYINGSQPSGWSVSADGTYNFPNWKKKQIKYSTFSEWSTVMIIKAIQTPDIIIKNMKSAGSSYVMSSVYVEKTLTPLFVGSCEFNTESKEIENKYRFTLLDGDDNSQIETSGWLQHDSDVNTADSYRFKTILVNEHSYIVNYDIVTLNNYYASASPYTFIASKSNLSKLEDVVLTADATSRYAKENGCIRLYLNSDTAYTGSFVISRTSEKSNYQIYENLYNFTLSAEILEDRLIYTDFTIESGVKYRYAFQLENSAGLRTEMTYSTDNQESNKYHVINFDYAYLYRDGIQLKLQFNQKMSSFKHTVLRTKQDTIGGKYPYLAQNGKAYYAEFPITGLITFHMDEDDTFFTKTIDGCFYKGELIIPIDKFSDRSRSGNRQNTRVDKNVSGDRVSGGIDIDDNTHPSLNMGITTDLTEDNLFIERKFREKVEEFLNDFDYKLYRSPTEGNMIVGLMNVSLTPVESLGRAVYEFTATAYEVLENTFENLDESGIIDIGEFTSLETGEIYQSFGQVGEFYRFTRPKSISGTVEDINRKSKEELDIVAHFAFDPTAQYSNGTVVSYGGATSDDTIDIYEVIRAQEEISIGGGYRFQLERVTAFWIETYPQIDLTNERIELLGEYSDYMSAGDEANASECAAKIEHIDELMELLRGPQNALIQMKVNDQNGRDDDTMIITPNHVYSVEGDIKSLKLVQASIPIYVNYKCELTQVVDTSVGVVTGLETTEIWGQIFGIFTVDDSILTSYNYDYVDSAGYRVYTDEEDETNSVRKSHVITDDNGNILFDLTNFNVYRSKNIYDIIAEDARRLVALLYGQENFIEKDGQWTNGDHSIYYSFEGITLFDLETAVGTSILVSTRSDGRNSQAITMGYVEDGQKYPHGRKFVYNGTAYTESLRRIAARSNESEYTLKPLQSSSEDKDYSALSQPASDVELHNNAVAFTELRGALHYKGAVQTVQDLPADARLGDIYTVTEKQKFYVRQPTTADDAWTDYATASSWSELNSKVRRGHFMYVDPSDERERLKTPDELAEYSEIPPWADQIKTITTDMVNRYQFNPSDYNIRYITLDEGAFCIINYKCTTNQLIIQYQENDGSEEGD